MSFSCRVLEIEQANRGHTNGYDQSRFDKQFQQGCFQRRRLMATEKKDPIILTTANVQNMCRSTERYTDTSAYNPLYTAIVETSRGRII